MKEKLASGRETLGHHMNVTMLGANPNPNIDIRNKLIFDNLCTSAGIEVYSLVLKTKAQMGLRVRLPSRTFIYIYRTPGKVKINRI